MTIFKLQELASIGEGCQTGERKLRHRKKKNFCVNVCILLVKDEQLWLFCCILEVQLVDKLLLVPVAEQRKLLETLHDKTVRSQDV
ncbi:hypothetical protein ACA910_020887 [Epithemia clementina (nom. ined.)]